MTWGEFKRAVEEAGVEDDTEITYIDCQLYTGSGSADIDVEIFDEGKSAHIEN